MKQNINKAKSDIAEAASDALKVISSASDLQLKTIANAAAEALKVTNVKTTDDHDTLIEIKTKLEGIKSDIKELKDGTATQIADHETRLCSLETSKTKQNTMMAIGIGILSLLTTLLTYHLVG